MDRKLKGKLYAQAYREALEYFGDNPDEEALTELTDEIYDDLKTQASQGQQAQLEIYSESEDETSQEQAEEPTEDEDESEGEPQ